MIRESDMTIKEALDKILTETKLEFPDFEIIEKKDSTLMKVIDVCLKIITLGQMNKFMTGFITTLGQKVYVTDSWKQGSLIGQVSILRHERIHMRQAKNTEDFYFLSCTLWFHYQQVLHISERSLNKKLMRRA